MQGLYILALIGVVSAQFATTPFAPTVVTSTEVPTTPFVPVTPGSAQFATTPFAPTVVTSTEVLTTPFVPVTPVRAQIATAMPYIPPPTLSTGERLGAVIFSAPAANTTSNITVCRNKDIKLDPAQSMYYYDEHVTWIPPPGANVSIFQPEYSWSTSLAVHNVTEDSEGTYTCIKPRREGTFMDEIDVSVTDCPGKLMVFLSNGKNMLNGELYMDGHDSLAHIHGQEYYDSRVNLLFRSQEALGSSVELRCSADGPVSEMYWFDGLKKIPHRTAKNNTIFIRIEPVGPRTCGYYTCVAVLDGCFLIESNNICSLEATVELYLQEYDMEQWDDYESEFFNANKMY